jgi:glycosyltransferase involved in cell wall biosynthesis
MVEKRFAFDLELFVVARRLGFRNYYEMPVVIGERFSSTISTRAVRNMLLDTFAIYYRLRFLRFYDRDLKLRSPGLLSIASHIGNQAAHNAPRVPSPLICPSDSLRILIFNWRDLAHPKAGGAEVYTHNIAVEFTKMGHTVTLFTSAVEDVPSSEVLDGIQIVRRGSHVGVYRQARKYYLREGQGKFDVVIDEINTRPFFSHKWVKDATVIALIHQVCRDVWYYQLPPPLAVLGRYWFEPRWLRSYREVPIITVSESSKESLSLYGLNEVTVVPEGYRRIENPPEVPKEDKPTVVFVGRLTSNKRPEEAIRAFEILRADMPTAVMWVIGAGPLESRLRDMAPDGVEFLGRLSEEEKHNRLARAHILVATSVREGWGLVVTEAANLGTPTIAYDVPGLRDSVRASNGILVRSKPEALADEMRLRLSNWLVMPPEVATSGVLTWDKVASRIVDIAMKEASTIAGLGKKVAN